MTKKVRFFFTLLLTMLFMGVSGCAGVTPTPATPAAEEPVEEESAPAEEAPAVVEEPAEPNYCLDCHTDKDELIATADEEEEVISENEGEG